MSDWSEQELKIASAIDYAMSASIRLIEKAKTEKDPIAYAIVLNEMFTFIHQARELREALQNINPERLTHPNFQRTFDFFDDWERRVTSKTDDH